MSFGRGGVRPARLELMGLEGERIAILVSAVLRSDDGLSFDVSAVDGEGIPHVALCTELDAGAFGDVVELDGEGSSVVGTGERHVAVPAVDDGVVDDHSLGNGVGCQKFIIGNRGEAVDVAVGFMDIHAQIGKVFLLIGDAGGFNRVGNDQSDGTEDDGADDDRTEDFPQGKSPLILPIVHNPIPCVTCCWMEKTPRTRKMMVKMIKRMLNTPRRLAPRWIRSMLSSIISSAICPSCSLNPGRAA